MSKRLSTSEFQERLDSIYGHGEFTVLDEYVTNNTKIRIKHNRCGSVILKAPVKMTGSSKEGCYVCSGKNHYKTKETLQAELDMRCPNEYTVVGEYVNSRTPLAVKRIKCGHIYNVSPDNVLRGKGCPRCSIRQSSYMNIVEEYLDNRGFHYEKEKTFDDCRSIRKLPFDYYIPSLGACIEVDGEFHYDLGHSAISDRKSAMYKEVITRDEIKTRFCRNSGIRLIRLPYFEKDNFCRILDKELYDNTEVTAAM